MHECLALIDRITGELACIDGSARAPAQRGQQIRSGGILGDGGCKGSVSPAKKTVCAGDTVAWSVINTCDAEEIADIRLDGLDRVTERCSVVRRLGVGGAQEIRCRLRRGMRDDVKQEYEVSGRIGKGRLIVDPELDIRWPR